MTIRRNGAAFRALYESLGLSQEDVRRILGLSDVKRIRERVHDIKDVRPEEWRAIKDLQRQAEDRADRLVAGCEGRERVALAYSTANTWKAKIHNLAIRLAARDLSDAGTEVELRLKDPHDRIK
ncbi:hypothetical protein [Bifidobacterium sp. ESL0745]|uniref:hypothetical protein n=1 Tax=Bifidobacterium sp. ESL0745 TaxID=2983226 RepID=UPI0023F9F2CD|nr:hypothetical protein [Bifidobacterium sp. ESL0745]MDF7665748.1 hypothetical protein [Bifidobacterium sp. ESL0745]